MRIVFEHIYHCEPQAFWAHHLDEASRRAKEVDGCGAVSFRFLSEERQGDAVVVRSEIVEVTDAPAVIRRIAGETTQAIEEIRWKEGSNRATVEITPAVMPDRVRMSGSLTTEPHGDGRCKVVLDLDVTVTLFGVSGTIEKVLAEKLPGRQERAVSWFNANLGS
ncbi:MAG: DUF2505 family protein [Myxococcota bacterium]|nr:DUF2505 family protein [Myxococcota bacterium]